MSATYCILIEDREDDSLIAFRDAVLTFAACRFYRGELAVKVSERACGHLNWLGLHDFSRVNNLKGLAYLDPSRRLEGASVMSGISLADGSRLPQSGLLDLRKRGYLAETVFASLVRSSYGPASATYFPTRSELGIYFDDKLILKDSARWSETYLDACQAFFLEELTPDELVSKSLDYLFFTEGIIQDAYLGQWQEELRSVAFLAASELEGLLPLARLFKALLAVELPPGTPRLPKFTADSWDVGSWNSAWNSMPIKDRDVIADRLCPGLTGLAKDILYALGPTFLAWRFAGDRVSS